MAWPTESATKALKKPRACKFWDWAPRESRCSSILWEEKPGRRAKIVEIFFWRTGGRGRFPSEPFEWFGEFIGSQIHNTPDQDTSSKPRYLWRRWLTREKHIQKTSSKSRIQSEFQGNYYYSNHPSTKKLQLLAQRKGKSFWAPILTGIKTFSLSSSQKFQFFSPQKSWLGIGTPGYLHLIQSKHLMENTARIWSMTFGGPKPGWFDIRKSPTDFSKFDDIKKMEFRKMHDQRIIGSLEEMSKGQIPPLAEPRWEARHQQHLKILRPVILEDLCDLREKTREDQCWETCVGWRPINIELLFSACIYPSLSGTR